MGVFKKLLREGYVLETWHSDGHYHVLASRGRDEERIVLGRHRSSLNKAAQAAIRALNEKEQEAA